MKAARVVSATAAVALVLLPLGIGATVAVRAAQQGKDLQAWPLVLLWVAYGSFVAAVAFRVLRRTAVTEAAEALAQARRDDDARVLDQIPAPARPPRISFDDLDDPEAMRLLEYNDRLARLRDQR
ncbi:hypothetical protein [Prescottella agglutinans]|uniref:Cytochrome c biogenesis protein CcdA n=1 Tax=Prescottella agglutinans TaxID=1644129 RepID=A0ABT6M5H3_9NOCA|nr:hypothetical protein [Prescottella agglutinans]MDH6279566.1 cytochrome c biogenesis protein CcdA [Prescottella agglutinans]